MNVKVLRHNQARVLYFILLLAIVWLAWSGLFKPLLLGLGVVSCFLTYVLVHRMGYFRDELLWPRPGLGQLRYYFWLGREVIISSIDVAKIVLDPKLPISPCIIDIKSTSSVPTAQAILGNSITLTPGTLTLDLHHGVLKVHSLTEAGAAQLQEGEMDRRVSELRLF